jgi:molecular chaperone GrpE
MKKDKKEINTEDKIEENVNAGSEEKEIKINDAETKEDNSTRVADLEKEVAELKDRLLRRAAEFENYKRRTENDQLNLLKYAAESLIIKLLPVVDDFERSLQHIDTAKDIDSLKQGIKMIYDKFMKVLDEQGVKKIESVGEPFNVEYHEAMMQRKVEEVAPHTVLDEIEKGYIYKDRVIRHAKVIVSEETETSEGNIDNSDNSNNEE